MEALLQMVNIDPALLSKVVPIVLVVMGCLSGLAVALRAIAKLTASEVDDKAVSFLDKALAVGQKIVDFLSGNVKH